MNDPIITSTTPKPIWPDDRIPGCLPRRSRPGAVCPMASERIKIIPRADWAKLAQDISLRPYVKVILDQDGVGSCAAESTTGALMIARAFAGLPHVTLSPWAVYHTTSGGRDAGSAIDDNLVFARDYGIPSMDVWPRSKGWRATPSAEAMKDAKKYRIEEFYDITSVDEMVSALLLGFPVVYGAAGHAVCKVQHLNDRQGLDLNSWGEDDGDGGFRVWANYNAINWGYGAFAVRVATQA